MSYSILYQSRTCLASVSRLRTSRLRARSPPPEATKTSRINLATAKPLSTGSRPAVTRGGPPAAGFRDNPPLILRGSISRAPAPAAASSGWPVARPRCRPTSCEWFYRAVGRPRHDAAGLFSFWRATSSSRSSKPPRPPFGRPAKLGSRCSAALIRPSRVARRSRVV